MIGNIKPKDFNFFLVKENINFIKRINNDLFIFAKKNGRLYGEKNISKIILLKLINFIFLFFFSKRAASAIKCTFIAILYPLFVPLNRRNIFLLLEKKKILIKQCINNLEKLNINQNLVIEIKELLRKFECTLYIHAKGLKKIRKGMKSFKKCLFVKEVMFALEMRIQPIKSLKGASGTYFMRDKHYNVIGVFKPFDEEIGAPNNPHFYNMQGPLGWDNYRFGIYTGQSLLKEVLAYKVSALLKLDIVPKTTLVALPANAFFKIEKTFSLFLQVKEKIGSLQQFKANTTSLKDLSQEKRALINLDQIQKLILLDIIIGNLDRHFNNILLDGQKVVAIDNALSFSDHIQDFTSWHWKELPHLKYPFTEANREIIKSSKTLLKRSYKNFISISAKKRMNERIALLNYLEQKNLSVNEYINFFTKENLDKIKDKEDEDFRKIYEI
jgi:hypothetical protein